MHFYEGSPEDPEIYVWLNYVSSKFLSSESVMLYTNLAGINIYLCHMVTLNTSVQAVTRNAPLIKPIILGGSMTSLSKAPSVCSMGGKYLGCYVGQLLLEKTIDYFLLGVSGHSLMYLIKNSKEVYRQEICSTLLNTT